MIYSKDSESGETIIRFINENEVEAVATAFQRENEQVKGRGNEPIDYNNRVASWSGPNQEYRGTKLRVRVLMNVLQDLNNTTETEVDEILDKKNSPARIMNAGRRYRVGYHAGELVRVLGMQFDAELIDPEPMGG